jgi:hypothetical protein
MVIERGFWPFRRTQVILDDSAVKIARTWASGRLIIISRTSLDLPEFSVKVKDTGVVDLTISLEEIRSRFSKTVRNEISRTERDPAFRFEVTEGGMTDDAYALYVSFENTRGKKPYARSVFDNLVCVRGYLNDELLACITVFPSSPEARIRSIFSKRLSTTDSELYARIGNASRRCMFEAIRWAKEKGCTGLDLASINMHDEVKAGISAFKLSFSPTLVKEYTYTRTSSLFAFTERATKFLR